MPQKTRKPIQAKFFSNFLHSQAQPKKQPNKLKPMNPNDKIMPKTVFIEPETSTKPK